MKTKLIHLRGAVLLSLLVTIGSPQRAPGAPPQSTGGGTIYYIAPWDNATTGGTAVMKTMNSEGSNKTQLGLGLFGPPSRALHGGHRWFVATLGIRDQYYPDGTTRRELFAFRDDYDVNINNTAATRVQLTDDITLEPSFADWVPGDGKISFIGMRWSSSNSDGTAVEGGLYTASLEYGGDGSIAGLASQPVSPVISAPLVEGEPGDWRPDLAAYSWAPAGDRVTYTSNDSALWVANLFDVHTLIFTAAHAPQWSPDGSKIAFTSGGIWTIKPNGTAAKKVVPDTATWFPSHVFWSPTGSHFVFAGESKVDIGNSDVFRVPATGGTWVNLTNTPAPFRESIHEAQGGWR